MNNYTFTIAEQQGEYGHSFPLLTANEYPYMNIQIIPTPPQQRDMIIDALRRRGGWIIQAEGRTDFVAIQAGGHHPDQPDIEINSLNYREVAASLHECMQAAADYWASTHKEVAEKSGK